MTKESKKMSHRKKHGENGFNEALTKTLKEYASQHVLKHEIRKISENDLKSYFPYYSDAENQIYEIRRWLDKETSKWINIDKESLPASLQKLYIYCKLAQKTPNDALLNPTDQLLAIPHAPIQLLSENSILTLINGLKGQKVDSAYMGYSIPVLCDYYNLRFGILRIYKDPYNPGLNICFSIAQWDMRAKISVNNDMKEKHIGIFKTYPLKNTEINISSPRSSLYQQAKYAKTSSPFPDLESLLKNSYEVFRDEFDNCLDDYGISSFYRCLENIEFEDDFFTDAIFHLYPFANTEEEYDETTDNTFLQFTQRIEEDRG